MASAGQVRLAEQLSLASGADEDELAAAAVSPVWAGKVDAPYVDESRVAFECRLLHARDPGVHACSVGGVLNGWPVGRVSGRGS